MQSRLDAAQGASAFTLALRKLVLKDFPDCVTNVGNMCFEPGAFNIIPERAIVSLEYRAPTTELLERLETALLDLAQEQAEIFGLQYETEFLGKHNPAPMNSDIQATFIRAAEILNLNAIPLASGAGHDAQLLAEVCPTGMIFVPSIDGISHSPKEFTPWSDCVNGANMLLMAVIDLASRY
jgi:N-carbamoyl-L-amino-acid hydrolase